MICPECGKEFTPHRSNQIVCSKECKRKRGTRQRIQWAKDHAEHLGYRSSSRVCPVCRKPLPDSAAPNQAVHKGQCTEIWQDYQEAAGDTGRDASSRHCLSDQEYAELGIKPPTPGYRRCLGPFNEHDFWSPDTRRECVCPKCKAAARAG